MGLLDLFRRKKKAEGKEKSESIGKSSLEELCGNDHELCYTLSRTLFLHPTRPQTKGLDSYVKKAKDYEKKKDFLRARIEYQVAGELALYEGKLTEAQRFFKKCAELEQDPEYKKIFEYYLQKENAEKALKIAQEFYARRSKSVKKEA